MCDYLATVEANMRDCAHREFLTRLSTPGSWISYVHRKPLWGAFSYCVDGFVNFSALFSCAPEAAAFGGWGFLCNFKERVRDLFWGMVI